MLSLLHFTDIHIFATENRWPRSPVGGLLWHHCGHQYGWSYHLHARNTEQWQLWPSAVYSKGCRALLPKTCQQNLLPKQVLNEFFPQPHFIAWAINQAPPNLTKSWTRTFIERENIDANKGWGWGAQRTIWADKKGFHVFWAQIQATWIATPAGPVLWEQPTSRPSAHINYYSYFRHQNPTACYLLILEGVHKLATTIYVFVNLKYKITIA